MPEPDKIAPFIARWKGLSGAERANYQLFLTELCAALDLPQPDPARSDTELNEYVFERAVPLHQPDGKSTTGRIDLYKRGCFVLEAKQYEEKVEQTDLQLAVAPLPRKSAPVRGTARWDEAMLKARGQAERYARSLPAEEEPPLFLIVVDVGHSFELYADFTQKGKAYLPFPDPTSHRFALADLARPEIRATLRTLWTDPATLDPARRTAAATKEIAAHLAELAKSFEEQGHEPRVVADFLARCLFCMFAEDVGLLPADSFSRLLTELKGDTNGFVPLVSALFREMNSGVAYSTILRQKLLKFNGGLFSDPTVLKVNGTQLGLLRAASKLDWRNVEPSIFGTLLERALDPHERHKLGAHYTPRAYVERLVLPTVIEPLREDWSAARAAAVTHARAGRMKEAVAATRAFHDQLCRVRVLDPACGSGNFLYVTLEHMKRLEGEVLNQLDEFGDKQALLDLATITVDPHQFLGIEINPRAAAVTDLVLWIGYLQWHFRTRGKTLPAEPVLKKFDNIQCRDAVLAYDQEEPVTWLLAAEHPNLPGLPDAVRKEIAKRRAEILEKPDKFRRKLVELWDRKSTKLDPATGRDVPDESKTVYLRRYTNPRPAEWPAADFIVGNPPFLGPARMREDLGDGYAQTLRAAWPDVPESANFVMYWWNKAAGLVRAGKARRFGLITTNNLRQIFNRKVVQSHLEADPPLSLAFAIPDHPWVDTADGAAVRIAMTVGIAARRVGVLSTVERETPSTDGASEVVMTRQRGEIQADLTVGVDVTNASELLSNEGIAARGFMLGGEGFLLSREAATALGLGRNKRLEEVIKPTRNGRDISDSPRGVYAIDLHGFSEDRLRADFPKLYQHLLVTVKPQRDQNSDARLRANWWLHRRSNGDLRNALASTKRYAVTIETSKFRTFQFLDRGILPDNLLVVIALDDAFHLGVLSSRIHVDFALAAGGRLGYGNDPRYNKTRCFDPFPFPVCSDAHKQRIRSLAEELDAHRKRAQEKHGIELTKMYNVLEKLRAGEALTAKEKELHDRAMISTLRQLHDDLDAAVADAYGWPWPMTDEEILERVVALNRERVAEEARGVIRWLRPDYQNPPHVAKRTQGQLAIDESKPAIDGKIKRPAAKKQPWPKTLPEQVRAIEAILAESGAISADQLARRFLRARRDAVQEILDTLATLGRI
jgi:hypothetical protein